MQQTSFSHRHQLHYHTAMLWIRSVTSLGSEFSGSLHVEINRQFYFGKNLATSHKKQMQGNKHQAWCLTTEAAGKHWTTDTLVLVQNTKSELSAEYPEDNLHPTKHDWVHYYGHNLSAFCTPFINSQCLSTGLGLVRHYLGSGVFSALALTLTRKGHSINVWGTCWVFFRTMSLLRQEKHPISSWRLS